MSVSELKKVKNDIIWLNESIESLSLNNTLPNNVLLSLKHKRQELYKKIGIITFDLLLEKDILLVPNYFEKTKLYKMLDKNT